MSAYYNEIDPHAAAWLRELIARNLIAPGDVDERSIEDVFPADLRGYTQHHFFAGIGGWSYALRLAGWPDDRPVWTGSCPCQPFSAAGKGAGFSDERHLWPAFFHLIRQCAPAIVFGEQVASKRTDPWFDLVHADLEGVGYAFGCVSFPTSGVGAPHIRERAFWLAHAHDTRREGRRVLPERSIERPAGAGGLVVRLADAELVGIRGEGPRAPGSEARGVQSEDGQRQRLRADAGAGSPAVGADAAGPANGFWRAADWLGCTDGKWRPVEPGAFPMADGIPARVVRLRGYGNAINPHQAAEFIRALIEATEAQAEVTVAA